MKNRFLVPVLSILFATATIAVSYAADTLTHTYPSAVLVELKSEQSRLHALIADKKYKELEEVKKDIAGAKAAMIRDFKDHFSYCPVYYFEDTDQNLILKKHFDGVLLNADGTPAVNIVINAGSKDYVIVEYGYPVEQPHHQKVVTDSAKYESSSGTPMKKGLVINNDKMQQMTYLYNMGYDAIFINKKDKPYSYSSKHFNIDYFPSAEDFNKKLKKRKNEQRIKMNRRSGE